ncbi:protein LIM2 [Populus alba x Populus x berolinensis]|nr:protein LIM2 [Populus alba x Populus x berolinensis]
MVKICGVKVLPFLVLVLMLTVVAEHGQAHPCGSTFFSALIQLIPCRAAVAPFSPIQPSELCCSAVKALGQPCLCTLVNGPPISGVDRNMALQLPDKCSANFEPCNSLSQKTRASTHTASLSFFFSGHFRPPA